MKIKITKVCCIVFMFFTTIKLYSKELFNSMDNTFWISVDFIESLSDKNRNKLEEKYPNFRTIYNDYDGEKNIYWYERDAYEGIYFYLTDSETCKQLKQENFGKNAIDDSTKIIDYGVNASTFARYYFNEYKILNNEIIIKIIWEYIDNGAILNKKDWRYDSEKEDELKIILDGDYLQLYYCGNYVHTFWKLNEQTLQELKRFIKTETCDFTKITWPRHADGSCDYDDEIVGYVGNTGNCNDCDTQAKRDAGNGAHLHVQLIISNTYTKFFDKSKGTLFDTYNNCFNPFDYEDSYSNPIREEL